MELGTTGLVGTHKTALETVSSRADLEIEIRPGGLLTEEIKVGRKELKRCSVSRKITSLEAESSKLTDLIGYVLYELYSKHTLYLLDRSVTLNIYMASNDLLHLFLTVGGASLRNSVTNTRIGRDYSIDDNFVLILTI